MPSEKSLKNGDADVPRLLEEMRALMPADIEQLLQTGNEPLDNQMLTRFLRAEKLMPQAAATRLANYASWRNDCPMGSIRRDEVPNQIAEGKVYLTDALDKGGRPLMVIQGCKHTVKNRDLEESKRFTIYSLDTMVLRIDPAANADGKMCVLVDMRNVGYANLDAAVLRVAFAVLQNYYPERMHAVWFYDAPTIFWGTWKLVSPFLDPATRQKVHFVYSTDNSAAKLWEEFDRAALPSEYGGQGKMQSVDVVNDELLRAKKLKADSDAKVHVVPLPEQPPLDEQVADLTLTEA